MGICSPFHRYTDRASTPEAEASSVRRCKAPNHVPPMWFLTTLTAYSAWPAVGLLHPTTDRGFATFHASRVRCVSKEAAEIPWQFPQRGSYPPKISPHQQPVPRHRGPLPSCCSCPVPSEPQPKPRIIQPPPAETGRGRSTRHPEGNCDPEPQRERERTRKKKFRYDDAPIRRSGPPRHRAQTAVKSRSSQSLSREITSVTAGTEAPTKTRAIEPPQRPAWPQAVTPRRNPTDCP